MVNHWEVMEYLFSHVPAEKILYATDAPIALAPGKSVEINPRFFPRHRGRRQWSIMPAGFSRSGDIGKVIAFCLVLDFLSFGFPFWRDHNSPVVAVVFVDKRLDQHAHNGRDGQARRFRDFV
jgi:hypothetical protein